MTTNTSTKDALHQAAEALRKAEQAAAEAQRKLDEHTSVLRQHSQHALATKMKMYDAFYEKAVFSWKLYDLQNSCENYDREHNRAMAERNLSGDLLDEAAKKDFGHNSVPEDLERAAVRFNAAQQVLDTLQRGEVAEKRKRDGRALFEAEAEYRRLEAAYQSKKGEYEGERSEVEALDTKWNELRGSVQLCYEVVDQCQKELRKAARAYGKEVTV